MNIGEIISDSLSYPFQNMKALLVYAILGIIGGIVGGASLLSVAGSLSSTGFNSSVFAGAGAVGFIVMIIVFLLIDGYGLDIIKFGIERRTEGPSVDFGRQVMNAIKLIVVGIVYYIIPAIIMLIAGLIFKNGILFIIGVIVFIVFALAQFMAKCRLAKSDSLGDALAIGEAFGDISRVGVGKLIGTVIVIAIVSGIISLIVTFLSFIPIIGGIILGLASVYIVFFYNRAIGLLYSDV